MSSTRTQQYSCSAVIRRQCEYRKESIEASKSNICGAGGILRSVSNALGENWKPMRSSVRFGNIFQTLRTREILTRKFQCGWQPPTVVGTSPFPKPTLSGFLFGDSEGTQQWGWLHRHCICLGCDEDCWQIWYASGRANQNTNTCTPF